MCTYIYIMYRYLYIYIDISGASTPTLVAGPVVVRKFPKVRNPHPLVFFFL